MQIPKWFQIARNEYRLRTSRIRRIRSIFPYLTIGILAVYVIFIGPALVNFLLGDSLAFVLSSSALALIQVFLFMVFFYFILLPITNTLKEVQTSQLELVLAAPVKPSDVLLGEFLGAAPFYSIIITVIAGFFTALLTPLGLDLLQISITIVIFIITFLSALWIGTTTAAVLRTRLGRTVRGKDFGRALALIVGLPIVALLYSVMGGGLMKALADPKTSGSVEAVLGLLPSSWGAKVVVIFANNPGNVSAVGPETATYFGGLVVFFLTAVIVGTKIAGRAYSLEPTTFVASKAKTDGVFYNTINRLAGDGSFGLLLVSVFKDYGRRMENLSRMVFIVAIFVLINLFLVDPAYPEDGLLISSLLLPLLSAFVVGEVTLRGKENLYIYKKAPSGVAKFIRARLLHGWLIAVPVAVVVAASSLASGPQTEIAALLVNTGVVALISSASVALALGLFLLNPAFSDKSGNYVINLMILMQGWTGLYLGTLTVLRSALGLGFYEAVFFIAIPLSWSAGMLLLYLGKRNLNRME